MADGLVRRPVEEEVEQRRMTRALRILLVIAATYPVWGFAYEVVTAYWPPHWMLFWVDRTRPKCGFCGGGFF